MRSSISQPVLRFQSRVDEYKSAMLSGNWRWEESALTFVYWRVDNSILIAEGHNRMNAAIELGEESGDWSYVENLLAHSAPQSGSPPEVTSRLPRRGIWRRLVAWLAVERQKS